MEQLNNTRAKSSKLFWTFVVAAVAFLFVLPLIWTITASLKSPGEVFAKNWLPKRWRWDNYATVWTYEEMSLARCYLNTVIIVLFGTVGCVLVSSLAAYAFAKIDFKGKNFIFLLFMSALMIPVQVTILPRFILFYNVGIYNTLWALIIPGWFNVTIMFLLRQFYMSLPNELVEAAKIDGAGHFRIFWQILLPLTKPALVSAVILRVVSLWNDYLNALVFLPSKENFTLSQAIRYWLMDTTQPYHLTMASAVSAIVPMLIVFIIFQKQFVEGIATSGIKG